MNYKELLRIIDSQETASIKEARRLLVAKAGMSEEQADKWVRSDLRGAFPILRDKRAAKFILGTTRLFVEQELNDADAQNKMARILKEVVANHYDDYDRNLNGDSLDKLYKAYEGVFKEADEASRAASKSKSFGDGSRYTVTGPFRTYEDAHEMWGDDSQTWCVFHDSYMFDNYTSAGQQFYVIARDDWKSVPEEAGEGAPKDDYGNSLIAVSVDLYGNLATSTPRWNHAHNGNDHTYTVDEIEDFIQKPFYDTFKPKESKLIAKWGDGDIVTVREVDGEFKCLVGATEYQGPSFLHYFEVNGSVIKPKFDDPLSLHVREKGYNFLNRDGHLLSKEWFDFASGMWDDDSETALVKKDNKANFLKKDGTLLVDMWFNSAHPFEGGFAAVGLKDKGWNYLKPDGTFLSDKWFTFVKDFSWNRKVTMVKDGSERYNFIRRDGTLLSEDWFKYAYDFEGEYAQVQSSNGTYNLLKDDGTLASKKGCSRMADLHEMLYQLRHGGVVDSRTLNLKSLLSKKVK